jgi:hypothetical protein
MRRVTHKVRKVSKTRQLKHYVFNSEVHREDKLRADKRRAIEWIPMFPERPVGNIEFPQASKLAENLVRLPDGRWKQVHVQEYLNTMQPYTTKAAGAYERQRSRGGKPVFLKKTGEPAMNKEYGHALHDVYVSLPPWITEVFADMVVEGGLTAVREVVEQAALEAAEVLEQRTGYKAVGVALHPDSKHAFGIHIQYLTIEKGQMLGRSRGGGVGRRGMRIAGDVNCAMHRFNKVREIPGPWQEVVATRDYDDIAMLDAIDAKIDRLMPGANYLKKSYVDEWLERRKKYGPDRLAEANDLLRQEVIRLEKEILENKEYKKKAEKKVSFLRGILAKLGIKEADFTGNRQVLGPDDSSDIEPNQAPDSQP